MTDAVSNDRVPPSPEGGTRSPVSPGRRWRRVFGAVGALAGLVQIVASTEYGFGTIRTPGPAIFPTVTGVILLVCGLAVVFERESVDTRSVILPTWAQTRKPALLMGIIVVYVLVIPVLGVTASSWLMFIAVGLLLGQRSWWKLLLAATLAVVITRLVFVTLLRVPLPEGLLRGFLW